VARLVEVKTVNKMISSEFLFKTINQAGKTSRPTRVLFMKKHPK
jgi:hypothetical protein